MPAFRGTNPRRLTMFFNIASNTISATISNLHRHGTSTDGHEPYVNFETQDYVFRLYNPTERIRFIFWIYRKDEAHTDKSIFAGFERMRGFMGDTHRFSHYAVEEEDEQDVNKAFEQARVSFRKLSRRNTNNA
jgi:hypothetical protein